MILDDHAVVQSGLVPYIGYDYRVDLTNEIELRFVARVGSQGPKEGALVMGSVARVDRDAFLFWPAGR